MAQQLKMKFINWSSRKKPIYSSSLLRYALTLRYTSMQSYKLLQEEFNMPSVSLLKKLTHGSLDTVKPAAEKWIYITRCDINVWRDVPPEKPRIRWWGALRSQRERNVVQKRSLLHDSWSPKQCSFHRQNCSCQQIGVIPWKKKFLQPLSFFTAAATR